MGFVESGRSSSCFFSICEFPDERMSSKNAKHTASRASPTIYLLEGVIAIARRKMGLVLLHRRNWPNTEDTEVP